MGTSRLSTGGSRSPSPAEPHAVDHVHDPPRRKAAIAIRPIDGLQVPDTP
jgi:hypothetical protein